MALPGAAPRQQPSPVLPAAGAGGIAGLVPALLRRVDGGEAEEWLPAPVASAEQIVLLTLDGLGWDQLTARRSVAPFLSANSR